MLRMGRSSPQNMNRDKKMDMDMDMVELPRSPLMIPKSPKSDQGAGDEVPEPPTDGLTQVHVQALDALVSINAFLTGAVFIGLFVGTPATELSLVSTCPVSGSSDLPKLLLVWEIVAFSSYLLSSLVAQGLKLLIVLRNSKKDNDILTGGVHPRLLRFAMLLTAFGMVIGTVFLVLSIVGIVQVRLGDLQSCPNTWNQWGTIPAVLFISIGVFSFLSSLYFSLSKKFMFA